MLKRASFALKLLLVLATTVIVAVVAVAIVMNRAVGVRFREYVSGQVQPRVEALVTELEDYYAANVSWEGAETLLIASNSQTAGPGEGHKGGSSMGLALLDQEGCVVYATRQYVGMDCLRSKDLKKAQALRVDEHVVGYLLTGNGPEEEQFSINITSALLWAGGAATAVALLLGVLLIRTLSKPLRDVRDGAQRLAAGDLSYRVPVTRSDELGDVARQFNEMATALERDEQLRQRLMADIAHELRTPLTIIRAQVEALGDGVFPMTVENVAPIYDQTILLGRLVEDLRDLALAEAGRLPLERCDVEPGDLAHRVVESFQPQAQAKGIRLTCECAGDLPTLQADAQRLMQVLGNLLSNALRYTPAGGGVTVRAWADAQGTHLTVRDTGSGIAPEHLVHLFERFYRADKSRSRADGGTGLGLCIAKQLVEAHGGTIAVQSEVGVGTTFTINFPPAPEAG